MDKNIKILKTVMVGKRLIKYVATHSLFDLSAICDINEDVAKQMCEEYGVGKYYTDYNKMIDSEKPEVVFITTPNALHEPMTITAANSSVKGIYCEKPIAVSMEEAKRMDAICKKNNISLAINHQRRLLTHHKTIKNLIDNGAIGDVVLYKGHTAGDVLSDGTHLIDSILFFANDIKVKWIAGQIIRNVPEEGEGYRFGHVTETGAMACIELESGVRCELYTGSLRMDKTRYHHIEIIGTKGKIYNGGDGTQGEREIYLQNEEYVNPKKVFCEKINNDLEENEKLDLFYDNILNKTDYKLDMKYAMNGFQLVMGIYESARLHKKLYLPLENDKYPLQIMLDNGEL